MPWRFRPPLWAWTGTLMLGTLLCSLGAWQLDRAQHKRALEAAYAAAPRQAALDLNVGAGPARSEAVVRAQASGRYRPDRQILLDNQPRQGVPGYRVWTPMELDSGAWVLVDRGWVAASPDRGVLPEIGFEGPPPQRVSGFWRPLPEPGLRLADPGCAAAPFPRVLSFPTLETVRCVLDAPVLSGLLLLDPDQPQGYVREWDHPNPVPPSRHYAYAAQWFAFAATLLFLFFKLNLKPSP